MGEIILWIMGFVALVVFFCQFIGVNRDVR